VQGRLVAAIALPSGQFTFVFALEIGLTHRDPDEIAITLTNIPCIGACHVRSSRARRARQGQY